MSDLISDDHEGGSSLQAKNQGALVIPVIKEHLDISKELLTTGVVRIHKSVREREVIISEPLCSETVHVERVPVNVVVESAPAVRTEGEVTIIPVLEEVLVTTKQIRVVEEVRITRLRSTSVYQQTAILRSEEVTVERQPPLSSNKAVEEQLD